MNTNVIRKMWSAELKNLAYQLADKKIRVNAVSPGFVLTGYNKTRMRRRAEKDGVSFEDQFNTESLKENPLQELAVPKDVANTIVWLLSHINGINLPLNGGQSKAC